MKKILIIEDDEPLCWLLDRILKGKYDLVIMQNGLDALSWPSLDGIELLENIQTSGILRNIPVIMLSGSEDPEKRKKCLALGASSYIIKPFEPQLLIEEIENTFKRVEKPLAINR
jgi:two-component system, chemotaxis family, chemotaxis protein CheY